MASNRDHWQLKRYLYLTICTDPLLLLCVLGVLVQEAVPHPQIDGILAEMEREKAQTASLRQKCQEETEKAKQAQVKHSVALARK